MKVNQTLIHQLSWQMHGIKILNVHAITIINPSPGTLLDQFQQAIDFGHKRNSIEIYYSGHGSSDGSLVVKKGQDNNRLFDPKLFATLKT